LQDSGDKSVSSKHQDLDVTIREFGEGLEPGEDIQCRCVAIIIFDDDID